MMRLRILGEWVGGLLVRRKFGLFFLLIPVLVFVPLVLFESIRRLVWGWKGGGVVQSEEPTPYLYTLY